MRNAGSSCLAALVLSLVLPPAGARAQDQDAARDAGAAHAPKDPDGEKAHASKEAASQADLLYAADGRTLYGRILTGTAPGTLVVAGDDGTPPRLVRHQYDNHLGTAALELDGGGAIITYEEVDNSPTAGLHDPSYTR